MLHRFRLTPFALALSLLAGPLQAAEPAPAKAELPLDELRTFAEVPQAGLAARSRDGHKVSAAKAPVPPQRRARPGWSRSAR